MQIVSDGRPRPGATGSPLGPATIAAGASVPALLAVVPLTVGSTWYATADENREFLTAGHAAWGFVLLFAGVVSFVAFVIALVMARLTGSPWPAAVKQAAVSIGGLGLIACGAAMLGGAAF